MKPRVLIMIDTYSIGGAGKVILQFLSQGGKDLCDPHVAGFWRGMNSKWQFRDAVEAIGVQFSTLRQKHAFDPFVILDALKLIRENKIVLLESHGYKAHLVCLALSRMTHLPWVAYVHGWTSENKKVELYNFIDKKTVQFADKIIPVSESLKKRLNLSKETEKKVTVVTNAAEHVDVHREFANQRERFGVSPDHILVGVVGRLSPEKGHLYFVEALALASKKCDKIRAIFVGDGQERDFLANAIQRMGLNDKVLFAGYQEEVSSFYHACDMICLPSLSEGMPNAALEAMMFAKPVVASNVGGIPEVVLDGKTGYLVKPMDPIELADALLRLVIDPVKRNELGQAGKKRVESEFNPRVRTQKVLQIYQNLVSTARVSS